MTRIEKVFLCSHHLQICSKIQQQDRSTEKHIPSDAKTADFGFIKKTCYITKIKVRA